MKKIIYLLIFVLLSTQLFSQRFSSKKNMKELKETCITQQKSIDSLKNVIDSATLKMDLFIKKYEDTYQYLSGLKMRNEMLSKKVEDLYDNVLKNRYRQEKLLNFLSTPKDTIDVLCFRYFYNKNDSTAPLCNVSNKFYEEYKDNPRYKFYKSTQLVFPNWDDLMMWLRKENWNIE